MTRREMLAAFATGIAGCARISPRDAQRGHEGATPEPRWGVQSGDVTTASALVWCRSDVPAKMIVEWSLSPRFERVTRVAGASASAETGNVGKLVLAGLPPGSRVHYRARFETERASEWSVGALTTAPIDGERDVVFAWSGDTNGQGWGIDPARGGMPAYRAMLERAPDFFVHCGDAIYADGPIPPTIDLPGGTWNNLVLPAKTHVAETLDDFRGAHLYPRHSAEVRAFSAAVPTFAIWDDHEVHNNWFPSERLDDERYGERRVDVLAAHARRAWFEHTPTRADPMFRVVRWGPLLDVFLLDGRSYRTPNEPASSDGKMLGDAQLAWLEAELVASRAMWKVVACDMPLGLVIGEPAKQQRGYALDAYANEDGPPKERELELARLLSRLRERGAEDVVWITADVHYAAAHRFDPARARFKDMLPFWELVAGPLHATAFPQKPLDDTFGPEVAWSSAGPDTIGSPATGATNFGLVRIDAKTKSMHVTFVDGRGRDLHALVLRPRAR